MRTFNISFINIDDEPVDMLNKNNSTRAAKNMEIIIILFLLIYCKNPYWTLLVSTFVNHVIISVSNSIYLSKSSCNTASRSSFDILNRNRWSNLQAVKNGNVYEFAHSTSRSIYTFYPTLKMAKLFYPEEFTNLDLEAVLQELFDRLCC